MTWDDRPPTTGGQYYRYRPQSGTVERSGGPERVITKAEEQPIEKRYVGFKNPSSEREDIVDESIPGVW